MSAFAQLGADRTAVRIIADVIRLCQEKGADISSVMIMIAAVMMAKIFLVRIPLFLPFILFHAIL